MGNALYPAKVKGLTFTVLKTPEYKTITQTSPNGYETRLPQYANPIWHFSLIYDYLYDSFASANNTQAYAPYSDLQTLMGFFMARRAKGDDFLFTDPSDYAAAGLLSGNWQPNWTYAVGDFVVDYRGHAQRVIQAGISGTIQPLWSATGGTTADGTVSWQNMGFFPNGYPNEPSPLLVVSDLKGNFYSPLQRIVAGVGVEDVTDIVPGSLQLYNNGAPFSGGTLAGPGLAVPGASYMGLYIAWGAAPPPQPLSATFQFYFRVRFEEDTQDFERWMNGLWTIGGNNSKNGSGMLKLCSSRPQAA